MPAIDVKIAQPDEKPIFVNLMQLYMHDFSEFSDGTWVDEVGEDGLFPPYTYLDDYWRDADRVPLLLRADGKIVGFALINGHSHIGLPVERNMAEFFILRKHRRSRAGTDAARTIFSLYSGSWEVAVARGNVNALPFWRQAIEGCPGASDIAALDISNDEWDGPIFRFRTK